MRLFWAFAASTTIGCFLLLPAAAQYDTATCLVRITSDPPGAVLMFGGVDSVLSSPCDTMVAAGSHHVEASLAGYQTLVHDLELEPGDTLSLNFVLLAQKPEPPNPEDLGLSYLPITPLLPETAAQKVREKYNVMAETFAIIPLGQGIMAYLALGGGNDYFSGELVALGAFLSAGSYVLGRVMASRKLEEIRDRNHVLTAQNVASDRHNKEIDQQLRQLYEAAIREWEAERAWRGRVEVSGRRPSGFFAGSLDIAPDSTQ